LTYAIVITNHGPSRRRVWMLKNTLPRIESAIVLAWGSCSIGQPGRNCLPWFLASGASATVSFTTRPKWLNPGHHGFVSGE